MPAGLLIYPMDDKRKAAYRKILYHFLIQLKTPEIPDANTAATIGRYAGPVAYALHNFALASSNDFALFDEVAFWELLTTWDKRYPEIGFVNFRIFFEHDLSTI
jgi:hypothetical protein